MVRCGPGRGKVPRALLTLLRPPGWSPGERGPAALPEEGPVSRTAAAPVTVTPAGTRCAAPTASSTPAPATCRRPPAADAHAPPLLALFQPVRFLPEQTTTASVLYTYDYDPAPLDAEHLVAGHNLEGEVEDR
ncbi:hypothetical protein HPG69_017508 [Diceros bicornis minor]|uniref:Uncharacterized protein n=1 Tax=Diceros bicornis minor TaxID=77932 RepID=A0A7J7ED68_DICBM|nr:hypothetical protein HPG69_017508 [Diceros bicornis minor]